MHATSSLSIWNTITLSSYSFRVNYKVSSRWIDGCRKWHEGFFARDNLSRTRDRNKDTYRTTLHLHSFENTRQFLYLSRHWHRPSFADARRSPNLAIKMRYMPMLRGSYITIQDSLFSSFILFWLFSYFFFLHCEHEGLDKSLCISSTKQLFKFCPLNFVYLYVYQQRV